jgi:hypothetical protein
VATAEGPPARGVETRGSPPAAVARGAPRDSGQYEVDARLMVHLPRGDRRLRSGDRVAPGDALVLSFVATRPLHVYVINQDERGSAHLLFPLGDCALGNPLAGGRAHTLPGTCGGQGTAWQVSSSGGREHFLLMASPQRLSRVEERLASLPVPDPAARARGVGGRVPVSDGGAASFSELVALARSEAGPKTRARGLWFEEIVLENPAP